VIGCWGRINIGSAKMAMEKHKSVIDESEIFPEAHGMGATERKL
jgi:hypothetical protein